MFMISSLKIYISEKNKFKENRESVPTEELNSTENANNVAEENGDIEMENESEL